MDRMSDLIYKTDTLVHWISKEQIESNTLEIELLNSTKAIINVGKFLLARVLTIQMHLLIGSCR